MRYVKHKESFWKIHTLQIGIHVSDFSTKNWLWQVNENCYKFCLMYFLSENAHYFSFTEWPSEYVNLWFGLWRWSVRVIQFSAQSCQHCGCYALQWCKRLVLYRGEKYVVWWLILESFTVIFHLRSQYFFTSINIHTFHSH